MAQQLTRQALFDMIWQTPMKRLAIELGITPQALSKLCDSFEIPKPGYGYWTLREMGRPVEIPALGVDRSSNEIITIEMPVRRVSRSTVFATPKSSIPELNPKLELKDVDFAEAPEGSTKAADVIVPQADHTSSQAKADHPNLRSIRKALEKGKPDGKGFVQATGQKDASIRVGKASIDRALNWLSTFLFHAEANGAAFQIKDGHFALMVDEEEVAFHIEEKPDRVPHIPTAKELAEKTKWGHIYSDKWTPWPKYDHGPSGKLSVIFDTNSYSGLRRSFADGTKQNLENLNEEIFAAAVIHAATLKESRRKAEIARREAQAAQRRRDRQKAFEQREERRAKFVSAIGEKLSERSRLQETLSHLEGFGDDNGPKVAEMMSWIKRRLAEVDAILSPAFLDVSARSARIDFNEQRAASAGAEPSWYYPQAITLQLWAFDEEQNQATSQTTYEWVCAQGEIADAEGEQHGSLDPEG